MLLICERVEDVRFVAEAAENGAKSMFIEGVFLQSAIKNKNGRLYPEGTMDREVARYIQERVGKDIAYGELGHPQGPTINLDRVSHRIVSLKKEGTDYVGRAKINSNPMGNIVRGLIEDGGVVGVSSRGMGSLKENRGVMEVQDDFRLATAADVVADPSAPDAFVRGVMEGVQWWYDVASGSWHREVLDETRRSMKKMTRRELEEQKVAAFAKFVSSLSGDRR